MSSLRDAVTATGYSAKKKVKGKAKGIQSAASTAAGRIVKVRDTLMSAAGSLVTDQINKRILGASSITGKT